MDKFRQSLMARLVIWVPPKLALCMTFPALRTGYTQIIPRGHRGRVMRGDEARGREWGEEVGGESAKREREV